MRVGGARGLDWTERLPVRWSGWLHDRVPPRRSDDFLERSYVVSTSPPSERLSTGTKTIDSCKSGC